MNLTFLVFKKELRDMFRDKRVRNAALVMPPMIIVGILFLIGFLTESISKPSNIKVHFVVGGSTKIEDALKAGKLSVIEIKSVKEGEDLIQKGKATLVLRASPDELGHIPTDPAPIKVEEYDDPKQERSNVAKGAVKDVVNQINDSTLDAVLAKNKISKATARPVEVHETKIVVGGKESASEMVVTILPYLIVIWAFFGGMSTATELVAGEKEKNTLETLLISPATRNQIAMGKFLSLCVICLLSSLSSFIGIAIVQMSHTSIGNTLFPHGLGITPVSVLLILAVLLPAVALLASLLLAVSAYAKNPREAQTYLAGLNFIVIMPAMASQFIGYTDFQSSAWLYTIPVLNTATIVRQALQSQINASNIAICIAVDLVLALIGIRIAVTLFNRESVLTRV